MQNAADEEKARQERTKEAERCFRNGKQLFQDGQHEAAFAVWASGFRTTAQAFVQSKSVQSGLRKLRRDCGKKKLAVAALERHARSILDGARDASSLYTFFCYVLFEHGLFPECYERFEKLEDARARWRTEYEQMGEPLYARFRLTLLDGCEGNIPKLIEGLRFCQDRFPQKKHESLRLKQLLEAALQADEAIKSAHEGKLVIATPSAWEAAGFSTPFESRPWKRAGVPPDVARGFREKQFTAKAATPWARAGFTGEEARRWIDSGTKDPEHAKRWSRAGMSPVEAFPWEDAFGGDIEQAVLFFKAGFLDPREAAAWSNVFRFPSDAMNWREQGFQAEEAGFWYQEAGVKDPYSAKREKQLLSKAHE